MLLHEIPQAPFDGVSYDIRHTDGRLYTFSRKGHETRKRLELWRWHEVDTLPRL